MKQEDKRVNPYGSTPISLPKIYTGIDAIVAYDWYSEMNQYVSNYQFKPIILYNK